MIRIRETIHHGQYYNVTESEGFSVIGAFQNALAASPYNRHVDIANKYALACYADLVSTGKGEFGWARYEVIT